MSYKVRLGRDRSQGQIHGIHCCSLWTWRGGKQSIKSHPDGEKYLTPLYPTSPTYMDGTGSDAKLNSRCYSRSFLSNFAQALKTSRIPTRRRKQSPRSVIPTTIDSAQSTQLTQSAHSVQVKTIDEMTTREERNHSAKSQRSKRTTEKPCQPRKRR